MHFLAQTCPGLHMRLPFARPSIRMCSRRPSVVTCHVPPNLVHLFQVLSVLSTSACVVHVHQYSPTVLSTPSFLCFVNAVRCHLHLEVLIIFSNLIQTSSASAPSLTWDKSRSTPTVATGLGTHVALGASCPPSFLAVALVELVPCFNPCMSDTLQTIAHASDPVDLTSTP